MNFSKKYGINSNTNAVVLRDSHNNRGNNDEVDEGMTSLMIESRDGNLETVKSLIRWGLNINATTPEGIEGLISGFTALMCAVLYNRIEVVRELIKSGANVNAVNGFNMTALMIACEHGLDEIVEELCKNGANVNATINDSSDPDYGHTPLIFASRYSNHNIVKILCKYGVNLDIKESISGDTALMIACSNWWHNHPNEYDKVVSELLKCGANIMIKNNEGNTALDMLKGAEDSNIFYIVERAMRKKLAERRGKSLVSRRNRASRRNRPLSEENIIRQLEGRIAKVRHRTRSLNRR